MKLSVSYDFLPKRPSSRAAVVMDHFGIGFETGRNVIAEDLELPIQQGDVVSFTGASGSGKSSLMQATAERLKIDEIQGSRDKSQRTRGENPLSGSRLSTLDFQPSTLLNIDTLDLGERILVDALDRPVREALQLLSMCGLGEAQLLLRIPRELSDGQRYRFRLALALSQNPDWIVADEFSATLDRTLAKVVAFNVRRMADRTGTGFLLATTHEDILEDLQPDLSVRCRLDGCIEWERRQVKKKSISFAGELWISEAARSDWPYFAGWHYRSHNLGITRFVTLLWHGTEPIGICVFTSPAVSLRQRNRFFGLSGKWSRTNLQALNRRVITLSRVVLHPAYRGAGLAAAFIRRSCRLCDRPWVEALAQMGHMNPFFEKAGFRRVGVTRHAGKSLQSHSAIYGNRTGRHGKEILVSKETHEKSRFAEPVYYIFDNRKSHSKQKQSRD